MFLYFRTKLQGSKYNPRTLIQLESTKHLRLKKNFRLFKTKQRTFFISWF